MVAAAVFVVVICGDVMSPSCFPPGTLGVLGCLRLRRAWDRGTGTRTERRPKLVCAFRIAENCQVRAPPSE